MSCSGCEHFQLNQCRCANVMNSNKQMMVLVDNIFARVFFFVSFFSLSCNACVHFVSFCFLFFSTTAIIMVHSTLNTPIFVACISFLLILFVAVVEAENRLHSFQYTTCLTHAIQSFYLDRCNMHNSQLNSCECVYPQNCI